MAEVELQQIGQYTVTELLSASSTSTFYRGKQRKKDILIKHLTAPLSTTAAKEVFLTRARQLKKLKNRNIINLIDANFDGDYGYLVMEYVEGETLRQRIAPGTQIAPDVVRLYLSHVAGALHYAHVSNVLHSNLHPGNLIYGPYASVIVTEFALMQPELDDETFAIPYMAPEQLRGQPSSASDQYALAVMVYEWLSGRRPHEATERDLLLEQQEKSSFPPLHELNTAISPAIENVVARALSYNPAERYPHIQDFSDHYLSALAGFPTRPTTPPGSRPNLATTPLPGNITQSIKAAMPKIDEAKRSSISNIKQTGIKKDQIDAEIHSTAPSSISKADNKATKAIPDDEKEAQQASATISARETVFLPRGHKLDSGRYTILEKVGDGGGGVVYKAEDARLTQTVAIKQINQNGLSKEEIAEAEKASKQEVDTLKSLKHPSIPKISNYFPEADRWYLVMDFIEGKTLEQHLEALGWRLSTKEAVKIGIQLCNVLDYLHTREPKVIFRDLKPSNIMLSDTDLYLIDFGIARHFKQGKAKDTTIHGTIGYCAPEQYGRSQTTPCSDIYSLGVVLYQLLSGYVPSQRLPDFPPLQLGTNEASLKLENLIMQMVEIKPDNRPESAISIKKTLEYILDLLNGAGHSDQPQPGPNQPIIKPNQSAKTEPLQFPAQPAAKTPNRPAGDYRLEAIITSDLRQGGVLSQSLPGYEERPAQIDMAKVVARSLTERVQAIIEAGTGTGKSLAYLVPVVRSGKVGIISTANKALQEQLFYKDIPFIQKHIKPFEAALVKGMNNYVCLDRVEGERVGMQYFTKNQDFKRLLDIVNDPESTFTGDFETLGFRLPADIRGRVATDSDQCAWSKCSFFGECYVREMRENAQMAQIIVVNHTLLLLDAAMDGFLLPDRDVIVIDEAHHLEEEATRSFTITISPIQIQTLLAQRMLKDHSQLSLQDEALRAAQSMWVRLEQIIDLGYKGRMNLEEPLQEGLHLATVVGDLADSLRKQRPKEMPDKEGQLYDKLLKRTQNLSENMRIVFGVSQPDKFVYYADRVESGSSRSGFQLQASAAPLDVTRWLQERLFNKCNVISTSATLATVGPNPANPADKGPNFAYFRKRVGLEPENYPDVLERILPLAFDYESNALLYLPRHLPPPAFGNGSDDYMKAIAREMYRLVKISHGRAFLLFSSKRMLDRAYELMEPHLDFPLLKQGDMTRLELTRRFRKEEGAVLFGLKSFWEGVDIAGEALSLVVIDKLPFAPPDDPVQEARVERMKEAGENWFGTYVLPQAVLQLKQGLGRLLRTREDRGVMAILDTRLHTKGYGKMVLNALPPARRSPNIHDVEQFFS